MPLLAGTVLDDAAAIAAIDPAPPTERRTENPGATQEGATVSGRSTRAQTRAQKAAAAAKQEGDGVSEPGGAGRAGVDVTAEPEEDNFSDIDDEEIERYIHSADEAQYKDAVWTELNKDYLAQKAAKEAAIKLAERQAAESKALEMANDLARELEDEAAEEDAPEREGGGSPAKGRGRSRSKKRGRAGEPRAETAGEAAVQVLVKKRLSSKINYAALHNLFEEPTAPRAGEDAGAANQRSDTNRHEEALIEERRSVPGRAAAGRLGSLSGRPGRAGMRSSVLNRGSAPGRRVRFTENATPTGE